MVGAQYQLIARAGGKEIGRWSLTSGTFTLGKPPECLIVLEGDGIAGDAHKGQPELPAELQAMEKYEVNEQIAVGGMGAILSAHQKSICRSLAMKVILD